MLLKHALYFCYSASQEAYYKNFKACPICACLQIRKKASKIATKRHFGNYTLTHINYTK